MIRMADTKNAMTLLTWKYFLITEINPFCVCLILIINDA